jgi:hypothetical protein
MELTALSEIFGEYSIVVYVLASILISGYLLQVIIRKLYISLYQRNTNDAESLVTGPLRFFFHLGNIFAWLVAFYWAAKIHFVLIFPDEIFQFLQIAIQLCGAALLMLLLANGINRILQNVQAKWLALERLRANSLSTQKNELAIAMINVIAWSFAFFISAAVLQLQIFASIYKYLLIGSIVAIVLAALLFHLYSTNATVYKIVLSIVGYLILANEFRYHTSGEPLILRDAGNQLLEVKRVNWLFTVFVSSSEEIEVRDNASLMVANYGFKPFGFNSSQVTKEKGHDQNSDNE